MDPFPNSVVDCVEDLHLHPLPCPMDSGIVLMPDPIATSSHSDPQELLHLSHLCRFIWKLGRSLLRQYVLQPASTPNITAIGTVEEQMLCTFLRYSTENTVVVESWVPLLYHVKGG